MQYGFRKNRSTTKALSCVRRVADVGERTGSPTYLLLLDWKMAFDKVTHPALFLSLERIGLSLIHISEPTRLDVI
eukprot:12571809-Prorocentrum_lima.AAC.1